MYLDTDILYALMKKDDHLKPLALSILKRNEAKYTSAVTLLELEIVVKRELGDSFSLSIVDWLRRLVPDLKVVEFTADDFQKSLYLRQTHGLGIFDAVHAAVCLRKDGLMASSDHIFDRISGIKRVVQ